MNSLALSQIEIANKLFDAGAIKIEREGKFRFKRHEKEPDAPLSPIYFNLRTADNPKPGPLTPALVRKIAIALYALGRQNGITYDVVAGIPNAGDPFAEQFFELLWSIERAYVPLISFVKQETSEGRKIAALKPGIVVSEYEKRLLLLDDVLEGAETKFEAIRCAEENGFEVAGVLTLLHYDYAKADASGRLAGAGYVFYSALKVSDIIYQYYMDRRIGPREYAAAMGFLASR